MKKIKKNQSEYYDQNQNNDAGFLVEEEQLEIISDEEVATDEETNAFFGEDEETYETEEPKQNKFLNFIKSKGFIITSCVSVGVIAIIAVAWFVLS